MMAKATKTLLALALAGFGTGFLFVTGLVNVQDAVWLYVALPLGAIFFGLFLIAVMLEKEAARFDEEQDTLLASAGRASVAQSSVLDSSCCNAGHSHHTEAAPANAS